MVGDQGLGGDVIKRSSRAVCGGCATAGDVVRHHPGVLVDRRPEAVAILDLRGLKGRTRLRLLVRFGGTGDSATVEPQPALAGLYEWKGGIE